jgi:hypothetical protein
MGNEYGRIYPDTGQYVPPPEQSPQKSFAGAVSSAGPAFPSGPVRSVACRWPERLRHHRHGPGQLLARHTLQRDRPRHPSDRLRQFSRTRTRLAGARPSPTW